MKRNVAKKTVVGDLDEALLREFVELAVGGGVVVPTSRARRLDPQGFRRPRPEPFAGLLLPESYVRGVLGIDRGRLLQEGVDLAAVSDLVVREHLLFEGFWDKAKEKVADFLKDNPITNAADAAKRLGTNVNAVVASLTQVVNSGGDVIDTVASGAGQLLSKRIVDVKKATGAVFKRLKELAGKLKSPKIKDWVDGVAASVASLGDRLGDKIKQLAGGGGWKGMMAKLVAFLAVTALSEKALPLSKVVTDALSGEPKKMLAAAAQIKAMMEGDDDDDDEDDEPPAEPGEEGELAAAIDKLTDAFKGFAMGLVKKALGAAGEQALSQLAGPVDWVKKLGKAFEKVAGGISWVCEKLLNAMSRATFKPRGTAPAAT
jgi:hypothetical protein